MGNSKLVFSFLLCFISSYSSSSNHKCPDEQRDALLLFKQNISSINVTDVDYSDPKRQYCGDSYGHMPDPIRLNWSTSIDCCDWVGITCNHFTGDVISLNLTCGLLQGTYHRL
ncbi:putative leucine-rich repeat-containing, plant-type, leucine-rich repeat domain superfamily [Helianthus annuus]|nr:putative leucine-rich repeat-containing, plant-type, leucine-rich repeat domain superfamily [Helianthus annuus]